MRKVIIALIITIPIIFFLVFFAYFSLQKNVIPQPVVTIPASSTPSLIPAEKTLITEAEQIKSDTENESVIPTIQTSEERREIVDHALQSLRDIYASQESTKKTAGDNAYWEQTTAILTDYYSDSPNRITEDDVKNMAIGIMMSGKSSFPELEVRRTVIQEIDGKVNGIPVPPAPDTAINDATLAGVDTNVNGVRDDVERFLAQKFGTDKEFYDLAIKDAQLLQAAIIEKLPPKMSEEEQSRLWKSGIENPSFGIAAQNSVAFLECVTGIDKLEKLGIVDTITLNTSERSSAYGHAFAGISMGGNINCSQQ